MIGLLTVGGHHTDVTGLVEETQDLAQRIIVGAYCAQAHHGPDLDHRRRRHYARVTGSLGRGLVNVDGVLIPDGIQPVLDHRLVDQETAVPRPASTRRLDLLEGGF